jgi:hypothetical protein
MAVVIDEMSAEVSGRAHEADAARSTQAEPAPREEAQPIEDRLRLAQERALRVQAD